MLRLIWFLLFLLASVFLPPSAAAASDQERKLADRWSKVANLSDVDPEDAATTQRLQARAKKEALQEELSKSYLPRIPATCS